MDVPCMGSIVEFLVLAGVKNRSKSFGDNTMWLWMICAFPWH